MIQTVLNVSRKENIPNDIIDFKYRDGTRYTITGVTCHNPDKMLEVEERLKELTLLDKVYVQIDENDRNEQNCAISKKPSKGLETVWCTVTLISSVKPLDTLAFENKSQSDNYRGVKNIFKNSIRILTGHSVGDYHLTRNDVVKLIDNLYILECMFDSLVSTVRQIGSKVNHVDDDILRLKEKLHIDVLDPTERR